MKRLLGFLVNFYPNHFFYANGFCNEWDFRLPTGVRDNPHETHATTALLATAVAVGKHITKVGGTATAEFTAVTDGGENIGSFRVTVERIEEQNRSRT